MFIINKIQRKLIKVLASSNGTIDSYTLFKRSNLAFADFSKELLFLIKFQVVEKKDNSVSITSEGLNLSRSLLQDFSGNPMGWRRIPEDMINEKIGVNSLYVPSRKRLEKRTFNIDE
jgi:predicted transcriptional regulator